MVGCKAFMLKLLSLLILKLFYKFLYKLILGVGNADTLLK